MAHARGRRSLVVLAGSVLASSVLASCGGATQAAPPGALPGPRGELVLEFDEGLAEPGERLRRVQSSGELSVRTTIEYAARGRIERVDGRSGYAARLPRFSASSPTPAAAIVVRPRGADGLEPGTRPMRWGADVRLDGGFGDSLTDNGANVIQRGLIDDPSQFKLQVDHDVPSCRVQGDLGSATVAADGPLTAGRWYRLHCVLRNERLTLFVGRPGRPGPEKWEVTAAVGEVSFRRSTPVAVGAKVEADGDIVRPSTDQFNGTLDNVFLDIS